VSRIRYHLRGVLAAATLGHLANCGPTDAQQRASSIRSIYIQTLGADATCRAQASTKPENAVFAAKMSVPPDQAQQGGRTKVSAGERPALQAYLSELKGCRGIWSAAIRQVIPEILPLYEAMGAQLDANQARLLAGEITWSEANARSSQIVAEYKSSKSKILISLNGQLAAQNAAAMNERAIALELVGGVLGAAAQGAAYGATAPRPVVIAPTYVRPR
jgi:hypothetical protein